MIDLPALLSAHKMSAPFTTKSDFLSVLDYKFEDLLGDHFDMAGKMQKIHFTNQQIIDTLVVHGIPMETEDDFKANIVNHLHMEWSFA